MISECGDGHTDDASYEGLVLGYNNQRLDGGRFLIEAYEWALAILISFNR